MLTSMIVDKHGFLWMWIDSTKQIQFLVAYPSSVRDVKGEGKHGQTGWDRLQQKAREIQYSKKSSFTNQATCRSDTCEETS